MRIKLGSINIDDSLRQALWWYYNRIGWPDTRNPRTCPKASREMTRNYIVDSGLYTLETDVSFEYQQAIDFFESPDYEKCS